LSKYIFAIEKLTGMHEFDGKLSNIFRGLYTGPSGREMRPPPCTLTEAHSHAIAAAPQTFTTLAALYTCTSDPVRMDPIPSLLAGWVVRSKMCSKYQTYLNS
jgi:hypothetical protein